MPAPVALVVKNARRDVGRHAGPGISDRDQHVLAGLHLAVFQRIGLFEIGVRRFDRQVATFGHCVTRIDRHVEDRVLKLMRVGLGEPEPAGIDGLDADLFAESRAQEL